MIDFVKPIVKHITHPLFLRRDGLHVGRHLKKLEQSQWLPRNQLHDLQFVRLRKLLDFSYRKNSFHRARFKAAGIVPSDISTIADLSTLPMLSKDDIREAGPKLFSEGYDLSNTFHTRTGGSTGVPIHVYRDMNAHTIKAAATMRHNQWAGLVPGERVAMLWGNTSGKMSLRAKIRNTFMDRAFYLDTLQFDDNSILIFVKYIRRTKPKVLLGHAHSIYKLACFIRENEIIDVSFPSVITTAMTLSDGERRTIESVFSASVFNRYGCEEISIIASESSEHNGLHVFSEGLIIELPNSNTLDHNEIIITDLLNVAMPLLRYRIGDTAEIATPDEFDGKGLERLKIVNGRTADFLYRTDGTPLLGISILDTFVIHIDGIKQIQLIQSSFSDLKVLLVKDDNFNERTLTMFNDTLSSLFGIDMRRDIEFVEKIPQTRAGKYRFSICNFDPTTS